MGKIPSKTILFEVKYSAKKVKNVKGVHSVKINPMGPIHQQRFILKLMEN